MDNGVARFMIQVRFKTFQSFLRMKKEQ